MTQQAFRRFDTAEHLDPIFGDFENFESAPPPAPVKIIAITPDILAAEAAKQLAREEAAPVRAWAIKESLSNENLCGRNRKTLPGCVKDDRIYAPKAKPAKPGKDKQPKDHCSKCGTELRRGNIVGMCSKCQRATEPARFCSNGCPTRLLRSNTGTICGRCSDLAKRHEATAKKKTKCASETCERLLRSGKRQREDGLCSNCGHRADRADPKKKASCPDCGDPCKKGTKTGRCFECSLKLRGKGLKRSQTKRTQPTKEIHPMVETKDCAVAGCPTRIRMSNKSGRCTKHFGIRKGRAMRDGSEWGGEAAQVSKPAKAKPTAAAKLLDVIGNGMHLLPVSAAAIEAFWMRLDPADKVRIIAAELAR